METGKMSASWLQFLALRSPPGRGVHGLRAPAGGRSVEAPPTLTAAEGGSWRGGSSRTALPALP